MFHAASCDRPDGEHMSLEPDKNQYDDGTAVRYICQPPYTANGELRCVKGRWNGQVECTCKYILVKELLD